MVEKLVTVGKGEAAYQVLMTFEDEEYVPPVSTDKSEEKSEPAKFPTIPETMKAVGNDRERAQEALDRELARDEEVQRSSLVTKLRAILEEEEEEENA